MKSHYFFVQVLGLGLACAQPNPPVLTTLYSFQGLGTGTHDGLTPQSIVRGSGGVLYGITSYGGTLNAGTVFKLTPPGPGQTQWTEKIIYDFQGAADGESPAGQLAIDTNGTLYGTCWQGGLYGGGTAFSLSPPSGSSTQWARTTLYNFNPNGLYEPYGGLVFDSLGNLYGYAYTSNQGKGSGGIFRLTSAGGSPWVLTTLYTFLGGADGSGPTGVVPDNAGNVYGVTGFGGVDYDNYHGYLGTVFELTPGQSGKPWTKTVLYTFPNPGAGYHPFAGPTLAPNGTVYGTTSGDVHGPRTGTVFRLTASGTPGLWTETLLHSFYGPDGGSPDGPIAFDAQGNLYGTTSNNGETSCTAGCGTIFKLLAPVTGGGTWQSGWNIRLNGTNGATPVGNLVIRVDGTIYGVTAQGGQYGSGTVYQIQP